MKNKKKVIDRRKVVTAKAKGLTLGEMKRSRPMQLVELSKLVVEDFEEDPLFADAYRRTHRHGVPMSYSRISTDRIQLGFNKGTSEGLIVVVSPPLVQSVVEAVKVSIRNGTRPAVFLYRDQRTPGKLICSDDECTLQAYRDLKISKVPAIVMDAHADDLETTGLEFVNRALPVNRSSKADCRIYRRFVKRDSELVATLIPDPLSQSLDRIIVVCRDALDHTLSLVRAFHVSDTTPLHYHHAIASALIRSSRMVSAIERLASAGLVEQASLILRSLYELFLSMYLDWLAPEVLGDVFLWHARLHKDMLRDIVRDAVAEKRAAGASEKEASEWGRSLNSLYDLVSKASLKGEISPLRTLHDGLYNTLSSRSHQDYRAGSSFLHGLDGPDLPAQMIPTSISDDTDRVRTVLPVIVGMIVTIVRSDIGA